MHSARGRRFWSGVQSWTTRYCWSGTSAKPATPHNASTARVPPKASADPDNMTSAEKPSRARESRIRMTVISLA